MPAVPDQLDLERHRDLEGRANEVRIRRVLLVAIFAVAVAALVNFFGQHPSTASAENPAASLTLSSPTRLRGGLIFQVRIEVLAKRRLEHPEIVLSHGWFDAMTLNTTQPEPMNEATRDGSVVLSYDALAQGRSLIVWLQFQVNPTNIGNHDQDIELDDGPTPVLTLRRSVTVFP